MFILDSLLIGSLRFVLDKIVAAAEAEAGGEITADEFAAIERDVLARMREIKGSQGVLSVTSPDVKITGIEADVAEELTRR